MSDLDDLRIQITKLLTELRELASAVWGDDVKRDNGIRSDIRALRVEFDEAMKWAHEIWNVRRRDECIGIEALDRHLADHKVGAEGDTQVDVAKISADAARTVAEISAKAAERTQRWVVAGIIISAIISVGSRFLFKEMP